MYINLCKLMQKEEINSKMLAARLKINPNDVEKKLRGDKDFSIEEAFQIKRYYFPNMPLSYLFEKEEAKKPVRDRKNKV